MEEHLIKRIKDVATSRFSHNGYAKTLMIEIANEVGISTSYMSVCFSNKLELAMACLEDMFLEEERLLKNRVPLKTELIPALDKMLDIKFHSRCQFIHSALLQKESFKQSFPIEIMERIRRIDIYHYNLLFRRAFKKQGLYYRDMKSLAGRFLDTIDTAHSIFDSSKSQSNVELAAKWILQTQKQLSRTFIDCFLSRKD